MQSVSRLGVARLPGKSLTHLCSATASLDQLRRGLEQARMRRTALNRRLTPRTAAAATYCAHIHIHARGRGKKCDANAVACARTAALQRPPSSNMCTAGDCRYSHTRCMPSCYCLDRLSRQQTSGERAARTSPTSRAQTSTNKPGQPRAPCARVQRAHGRCGSALHACITVHGAWQRCTPGAGRAAG